MWEVGWWGIVFGGDGDMRRAGHDGGEVRVKETPRSSNGSRGKRLFQGTDEPFRTSPVFPSLLRETRQRTSAILSQGHGGHKKTGNECQGACDRGAWASD